MKSLNAKNVLKVAVIASLIALMSTVAWGRQRRHHEGGGDFPWRTRTLSGCYGGECEQGDAFHHRLHVRQPVSSVPEPTAALLFAAGGLVVAQAIRVNRKSNRKSKSKRN